MKLLNTTCPQCGAQLNLDLENKKAFCEFCGAKLLVDDEVKHVQYDNAEEAGYNFEKGRQRAQAEATVSSNPAVGYYKEQQTQNKPKKKRKTWLWILGWIFIFPLPLTIILSKNKNIHKNIKISAIIIAWLLYLVIGVVGGAEKETVVPRTDTVSSRIVVTDYANESVFETALNAGEDLKGKTVTFTVTKIEPDSFFGYNLQSGEHLNFCSENNPNVQVGDVVSVKVNNISKKLGSYIISYQFVD